MEREISIFCVPLRHGKPRENAFALLNEIRQGQKLIYLLQILKYDVKHTLFVRRLSGNTINKPDEKISLT